MTRPNDFIPIAKPLLGNAEIEAVARPLTSGWVTQGPEVAGFEDEFASYVGARYACAVSSCTTALHLALFVAGVQPGDEVITVSHSFIASANSILYCGATPVFVDIQPSTFNIDPELIEAAITEKTRAILCVHQLGMPCDLTKILSIAEKHDLKVIEDAACSIGSQFKSNGKWEMLGKPQGDIACFSFHPRKVITTGDGGMLTTNNPDYDREFKLLRQHGMSVPDTVRHGSRQIIFEDYVALGYNYRMTDIQAAIGREQLKRLPEIVAKRREFAQRYNAQLVSIDGLRLPEEPVFARSNWQSFCVRLPAHCDQRNVMQFMLNHNIATRRGVMCAHREPAFQHNPWRSSGNLKESEQAQDRSIILPLFHQMTLEEQDIVVTTLQAAIENEKS